MTRLIKYLRPYVWWIVAILLLLFGQAMALEHLDDPEILALVRGDVLAFVRRLVKDERLLALAPERAGPYYKVKKVLP